MAWRLCIFEMMSVDEMLRSHRSDVRDQGSDVGDQRSDVRNQRSEVRDQRPRLPTSGSNKNASGSLIIPPSIFPTSRHKSEIRHQTSEFSPKDSFGEVRRFDSPISLLSSVRTPSSVSIYFFRLSLISFIISLIGMSGKISFRFSV